MAVSKSVAGASRHATYHSSIIPDTHPQELQPNLFLLLAIDGPRQECRPLQLISPLTGTFLRLRFIKRQCGGLQRMRVARAQFLASPFSQSVCFWAQGRRGSVHGAAHRKPIALNVSVVAEAVWRTVIDDALYWKREGLKPEGPGQLLAARFTKACSAPADAPCRDGNA